MKLTLLSPKSVNIYCVLCVFSRSVMSDPVVVWTVAHQAFLSMEFSRQEYHSGLPFPTPGVLPDTGIEPISLVSPALAGEFFATVPPGRKRCETQQHSVSAPSIPENTLIIANVVIHSFLPCGAWILCAELVVTNFCL